MNEIVINDTRVGIKEYSGNRVVTLADIDNVHNRSYGTARRNFIANRKHFQENKDYYKLDSNDFRLYGSNPKYNYPRGGFLFTESGYLMITKSLSDEKAWKVQRMLVDSYFNKKSQLPSPTLTVTEPAAPATLNALDTFEKFLDVQIKMIEMERDNAKALREENAELRGMVKDLLSLVTRPEPEPQPAPLEPVPQPVIEPAPPAPIPKPEDYVSYTVFKRQVNNACKEILDYHNPKYREKNEILHEAYQRIRNQYGLVYDQEKKEFVDKLGRSPINTLELQWYIEQDKPVYRNLLISKLYTISKEAAA